MTMFPEDRAFVKRLLAGDEGAYSELFHVHAQKVYRYALTRVGDPHAAEDLVQTSLSRAIPKLAEFRGEASLLTWLCSFCRLEILNHRRKRQTRGVEVELVEDRGGIERALDLVGASAVDEPETRLLRKELAALVRALLDRLPDRYGDVLEWKYQQGLSVAEIADRLGVTKTAAQSALARARRAFREGAADVAAAARELPDGAF